jgi:hypothetical protein
VTPVSFGVDVAEVDAFLAAEMDVGDSAGDFAGDEGLALCGFNENKG